MSDCTDPEPEKEIVVGPRGPQGSRGTDGLPGSMGPIGPRGPEGSGTEGPRGPQGVQGIQGPQGYAGSEGQQGDPGEPTVTSTGGNGAGDYGAVLAFGDDGSLIASDKVTLKVADVTRGMIFASDGGIGIAHLQEDGSYNPSSGGMFADDAGSEIHGTVTTVMSLAGDGNRQVYCDEDGAVYSVEPPAPGWTVTITNGEDYVVPILGGGWVEIDGLELPITANEETPSEDRIDVNTLLGVTEFGGQNGVLQVAIGINGAEPLAIGATFNVGKNSVGRFPLAGVINDMALIPGMLLTPWVKVASQEKAGFNCLIDGFSQADTHQFTVSSGQSDSSARTLGWGNWADSLYTNGSRLDVDPGSPVKVTINGAGGATNISEMPPGVSEFWNAGLNKIVPAKLGDTYEMRLSYKCSNGSTETYYDIAVDIGGALGVIQEETKQVVKGATEITSDSFAPPLFIGSTFIANGGEIYLDTTLGNTTVQFWDFAIYIRRTYVGTQ